MNQICDAQASPLVNITESSSSLQLARFMRYRLQSIARHILPEFRITVCLRHTIEKSGSVDVYKHRTTQKAFYGGLLVCGSVWTCPVCAAKVSERRKRELLVATSKHRQNGGYLSMLTLTFSHTIFDKLKDMLDKLSKASARLRSGRDFDEVRKRLKVIGTVRAMEVTYGVNGWHPHLHLLIMHEVEIEPHEKEGMESTLFDLWERAAEKYGLTTSREHGLKLDDATQAASYIGKWGDEIESKWQIESEMTKSNTKRGRESSMTPFDFLRIVEESGDLEYAEKFREYATAMIGKTQLYWSRGLKTKFAIGEKTDEEIANEKEEEADLLGKLSWSEWRTVLRKDVRAEFLSRIETDGYDETIKWLKKIDSTAKEPNW